MITAAAFSRPDVRRSVFAAAAAAAAAASAAAHVAAAVIAVRRGICF